jgi:hypothetical protein
MMDLINKMLKLLAENFMEIKVLFHSNKDKTVIMIISG